MKKIFFLLIIINHSLLIDNCFCQWVQQTSGVSVGLAELKFINTNTGWICGNGGTILKTTNGGTNWVTQNSGVSEGLRDIHPVDSDYVYCVGIFETILKTTNGGTNWIIIRGSVNPGKFFYGVSFINRNTGWICGSSQWVLRTNNGFAMIDSSMVGVPYAWDIYFKDNMNGLIAGETGSLYKSTNGGVNWNFINVLNASSDFFELSFIGDIGWIIGLQSRKVYKTTNFGSKWDSVGRIIGTNSWFASIFFSSLNTGWVCGDVGSLYSTDNGGINWYRHVVPMVGYSTSYFVNDSIGWADGSIGTIIHTTTGGQIVSINNIDDKIPTKNSLLQNYPNPFNINTIIKFQIANNNTFVNISVFDITGKHIGLLINDIFNVGTYELKYRAGNLSSGIYFYVLRTNDIVLIKKMILIK